MLSIAICTYNRVEQLRVLLNQFVQFNDGLKLNIEILIIDNNSQDATPEMVNKFSSVLPISFFKEPEQGLACARNRAIIEYKGDALLFVDDDVSITLGAIQAYSEALKKYPDTDFFGGKINIDWQGDVPNWLKSDDLVLLNGLFGKYDLGSNNLEYGGQHMLPFGANFILRRQLIDKVGSFDIALGVKGQAIGRGEETDYFNRACELNFKGMYIAAAEVGHRFQRDRVNLAYLYRYGIQKGRARVLVGNEASHKPFFLVLCSMLNFSSRGLFQLLKCRRDRFYQCVINSGIEYGFWRETKQSKVKTNA